MHYLCFFFSVLQVTINWARCSRNKDATYRLHACVSHGKCAYHYQCFYPCLDIWHRPGWRSQQDRAVGSISCMDWNSRRRFYVCCEQSVLTESKNVRDAIIDLMATYYVFDMAYPKTISAVMLFFQHSVFKLLDNQALPGTTSKLVSNLSKLS